MIIKIETTHRPPRNQAFRRRKLSSKYTRRRMIFYPFTYEIGTMHDAHTAHARVDRSTRLRSSILFRPTMSRANFTLIKTVTYDCCEPKDRERATRVKNHRLINQSNLSSSPLLSPFCFQFQVSPKKKKKKSSKVKENSTQFWNSNYYSIEQFHSRGWKSIRTMLISALLIFIAKERWREGIT